MGLLESVLGSVLGGGASSQQAPNTPAAGGSLGGSLGGGLGGIIGALAANPQLMQVLMSLLSGQGRATAQQGDGGGLGGLGGLAAQFQQAGLGDVLSSWIGTGQNRDVSPDQVAQVFGQDQLSQLGAQLGMDGSGLAGELSRILPGLVDQMTPQGQVPTAADASNPNDLFGMLEAFQQRR